MKYESLQGAVRHRIRQAGGLRRLSRSSGVSASYLCRISKGARIEPSEEILEKLGLSRVVHYVDVG